MKLHTGMLCFFYLSSPSNCERECFHEIKIRFEFFLVTSIPFSDGHARIYGLNKEENILSLVEGIEEDKEQFFFFISFFNLQ